jgi:uncharacterized protein (TIGR02118 family)
MLKVILLMKRHPDLSVVEFQGHWLERHAPLVAALPGLRRYVQSHALVQGYRKGELLFDGISELWFDDEAAWGAAKGSDGWAKVARDLERLVELPKLVEMVVDVHVIKDGPIPSEAVKNVEFVNRRPGMQLDRFRAYWLDVHGPLAAKIPVLRRYEQNHLKASAYSHGDPVYDGLAVTWFDSTADMKRGTTTGEYQETRADEPCFLPDGHLPIIITREHQIVPPGS